MPPAPAAVLALQRTAGNAAVGRLLRLRRSRPRVARAGWTGGGVRAGGWNADDRLIGRTLRLAIDGITRGGTRPDPQKPHTDETAASRAIVVVPPGVSWRNVDVLLHFHGHNVGYRERTDTSTTRQPPGTVRDVEADEIEQQLESSGRHMIAVLPQGTAGSDFGIADPAAYVDEVLSLIPNHLPLSGTPTRGHLVISGHSGGGPAATAAATAFGAPSGATEAQWLAAAPLFLFDAINGTGELATVKRLVTSWLNTDLAILTAAGGRASSLLAQRGVRFISTYTGGVYAGVNVGGTWDSGTKDNPRTTTVSVADSVRGTIDAWFRAHRTALGTLEAPLRDQYRVEPVSGSHDYTVGTGRQAAATDRNTNITTSPTTLPGASTPDVPNYTAGTGHLDQALGRLFPETTGGTLSPTRRGRSPSGSGTAVLARQVPPPGGTTTVADAPTAAPAATPDAAPDAEIRTAIAALRDADAAVTAANGGTRAARSAAAAQRTAARTALQQAALRLAATLRAALPPRSLLDGYLARTDVSTADKVRTVGRLAAEVGRMEFLLGRMHHRGVGTWETAGSNQGPFPDVYRSGVGGGTDQPWCTKFAGYSYTRLGFHAAPASAATSMFQSGYRLQHWSSTGKTLGGASGVQTTDPASMVASGTGGSVLVDSGDWRGLTRDLTRAASAARTAHQDEAAARLAVTQTFLAAHAAPQAGDIVVKTRGSATTNSFSGGLSHTMMVDRFDGRYIYTIEGNRSDQVGARRLDLTEPADTGQIIFLTRLATQFFGDPAVPAPDLSGLVGLINRIAYSEALLVGVMHGVNARLVEIDFAQGWIASGNADAGVYEWQGGGGSGGSES